MLIGPITQAGICTDFPGAARLDRGKFRSVADREIILAGKIESPPIMRLDQRTRVEIREAAKRFFGADVYLFGSRADDTRRGGDIDLYIESALSPEEAVRARLSMLARLYRRIGERRIDLVLNTGRSDEPIFRVAKREGMKL